jgi:NADPH2:quinone reductase
MRAIVVQEFGPIDSHRLEEVPDPEPGPGEVLVATRAIGLNFPDALMLEGKYQSKPESLPFVPGRDASGVVEAVGDGVTRFEPGDAVTVQVFSGAFAEKIAAPEERCFAIPEGMDFAPAAAMITTYRTAYMALVIRGRIQPGETALVTGAAGGVGVAALQLLKAKGATAIAAVSTPEKAAFARENGADHVITTDHGDLKQAFREQIEEITGISGGRGCNLVIDMVGGDVFEASLRVLKFAGRLIVVGFTSGQIPAAKANYLLFNNLTVMGAPLDIHFKYAYPALETGIAEMNELYLQGKLNPGVTETFPLDEFKAAFARITGRNVMGKIVLLP